MDLYENEQRTDITKCPICLEEFSRPKYLPCLHTICEPCLNLYVSSMQKAFRTTKDGLQSENGFNCPICKAPVPCPWKNLDSKEWAQNLPDNTMILALLEKNKIKQKSEVCYACKAKEDYVKAVSWCSECEEALCGVCTRYHKSNKALRGHCVFNLGDIEADPMLVRFTEDEPCERHHNKRVEVYCRDHDALCCVICVTTYHRTCMNVLPIEEAAKAIREKGDITVLGNHFKQTNHEIKEMIQDRKRNIDDFSKQFKHIENDISTFRTEVNRHLDELEEKLKKKMTALHNENRTDMKFQLEQLENREKAVNNCKQVLDTCKKHGSDVKVFLECNKLRKLHSEHERHLQNQKTSMRRVDYCFTFSPSASSLKVHLTSLGDVTVSSVAYPNIEISSIDKFMTTGNSADTCLSDELELQSSSSVLDSEYSTELSETQQLQTTHGSLGGRYVGISEARLSKTIYVNKTVIVDAVILPDGRIIIATTSSQNSKLFVYQPNGSIEREIRYETPPGGITVLDNHEVAITLPMERTIQFLSSDSFEETKEMKIRGVCTKICNCNDKIIVLCGSEIKVFHGTSVRTISYSGDDLRCMCSTPKERLYCTFKSDNALHCLSMNADEIFKYTHAELVEPNGVSSDRDMFVYVAGYKSQNVHYLTPDGRLIHIVLTPGDVMSGPQCLAFEENGGLFLQVWEQMYGNFLYIYRMPHETNSTELG